jgi:lipopolysaccharide/colanic/teichoic acid biosynthesis glycosyltransferase
MSDLIKRLIDILLATTSLVFLSPLLLAAWAAIRIEDGGPSLYVSKRVGKGYRVFNLFKFRTMYRDAESRLKELANLNQYAGGGIVSNAGNSSDNPCSSCAEKGTWCSPAMISDSGLVCERLLISQLEAGKSAPFVKFVNDPRVTRVGRILRRTSVDELPQLLNVLKGEMSIVGNRPLPLYEAQVLTRDTSVARFMAPAGLTGLWQVTKRGGSDMSADERIGLDVTYARKRSLRGDLTIILKTVPALIQAEDV